MANQRRSISFDENVLHEAEQRLWRGDAKDARVARLLKACTIEALDERMARAAGRLRRATPATDTIDGCIAVGVSQRHDAIATSDPNDLRRLLGPSFTILKV
jgi:predicted nucleic acid-binding protein